MNRRGFLQKVAVFGSAVVPVGYLSDKIDPETLEVEFNGSTDLDDGEWVPVPGSWKVGTIEFTAGEGGPVMARRTVWVGPVEDMR